MTISKKTQEQAYITAFAATYAVALEMMHKGRGGVPDGDAVKEIANCAGIDAVCELLNADVSCVFESEANQQRGEPDSKGSEPAAILNPIGFQFVTNANPIDPDAIHDLRTGRRFLMVEAQPDGTGIAHDDYNHAITGLHFSAQEMEAARRSPQVRIEQKARKPFSAHMVVTEQERVRQEHKARMSLKQLRTDSQLNVRSLGRSEMTNGDAA